MDESLHCDKWVPVNTTWRVLGCGWRNGLQIWRVAANVLNSQSRTAEKG